MPHTWWHQWDYLPDTQEPAADPTVFQEYLFPAARAVGSGIAQVPGVMPTLQGLGAGLEFVHGRVVQPFVSQAIEPIPFNWELDEGVDKASPWYRPISKFSEGKMVPNFEQYTTPEGDFSPAGAFEQFLNINPITNILGVAAEGLDIPEFRANTIKNQRINAEVQRIEQETGQPVSEQERRRLGEDLYPTLPYARGIAEELPYFLIPPAKGIRTAAQAARVGSAAANNPAVRVGLRGVELGLKPLEIVEEAAAKAITAPFNAANRVINPRTARQPEIPVTPQEGQLDFMELRDQSPAPIPTNEAAKTTKAAEVTTVGDAVNSLPDDANIILPNGQVASVATVKQQLAFQRQLDKSRLDPSPPTEPVPTTEGVPPATPIEPATPITLDTPVVQQEVDELLQQINQLNEETTGFRMVDGRREIYHTKDMPLDPFMDSKYLGSNKQNLVLPVISKIARKTPLTPEELELYQGYRDSVYTNLKLMTDRAASAEETQNLTVRKQQLDLLENSYDEGLGSIIARSEGISTPANYEDIYNLPSGSQIAFDDLSSTWKEGTQSLPTQRQMSVRVFEQMKARIPDPESVLELDRNISKGSSQVALNKLSVQGGNVAEDTIRQSTRRNKGWADKYINWLNDWWGNGSILRTIIDSDARAGLSGGSLLDNNVRVAQSIHRWMEHAGEEAMRRTYNFLRTTIVPLEAKGVPIQAVNRYVHAHTLKGINAGFKRSEAARRKAAEEAGKKFTPNKRKDPLIWNAETKKYDIVADELSLESWSSREWIKRTYSLTDDQVDETIKAGDALINLYSEQRARLFAEGIISKEKNDYFKQFYPGYTPTKYVDYADNEAIPGVKLSENLSVTDDGIRSLSDNIEVALNRKDPLDPYEISMEVWRAQLKIHNNRTTRSYVAIVKNDMDRFLKDVTDEYINTDGSLKNKIPAPKDGRGYFVYFENGKRKVFGGMDGGMVPKAMWQEVNGRAGYIANSSNEVLAKLAATNGFFRSVFTTYSPLFWVRNAIIDMFTVQLKAGVTPDKVTSELGRSLNKAIFGKENNFKTIVETTGGWSEGSGFVNFNRQLDKIQKEFVKAGQLDDAILVTNGAQLEKELRKSILNNAKSFMPKIGAAIESAPRIAVAKKAFIKKLNEQGYNGKAELKRIMNLSKDEFENELLNNWQPVGGLRGQNAGTQIGLKDIDFVKDAAATSMDATIDFFKGGTQMRKWNQYILFLNAAAEGGKVPFRALGIDLHPDIKVVDNPVPNGPMFEFGTVKDQIKKYGKSVNNLTVSPLTFGTGYREVRGVTGRTFDAAMGPKQAAAYIGGAIYTYFAIQEGWNKTFEYNGTPLYYDIPEYIRYNAFIFMLPPKRDEAGELIIDPVTQRPKPQYIVMPHRLREWNSLFGAVTYLSEATDADAKFEKAAWGKEVWKSTFPINEIPMPEVFAVAGEQLTGYDLWRQSQIVVDEEAPLGEQYTRRTSKTVRDIAGVIDELPVEDIPAGGEFLDNIISSPDRLQHLYESIFGSTGQLVLDMGDWAKQTFDEIRDIEQRPMSIKVEEYRQMNKAQRAEFRLSLNAKEYKAFEKELREPTKKQMPFIEGLKNSFYPERGGALIEAGRRRAEQAFPEISREQTREAGIAASKVREQLVFQQQDSDAKLLAWWKGDKQNGITPQQWREEKSTKYLKYEGAQLGISQIFKYSIQNQPDDVKESYYNQIYNAAGTMKDIRNAVDILLVNYYAIEPNTSNPEATDWDGFFKLRTDFVESIKVNSETRGDGLYSEFLGRLNANDTPTEQAYENARSYMREYWEVGKNLNELFPNLERNEEIAVVWKQYLNASNSTKYNMRKQYKYLTTLEDKRNALRNQVVLEDARQGGNLDEILVYWYGEFYRGRTPQGKAYHNQLYGNINPLGINAVPQRGVAVP